MKINLHHLHLIDLLLFILALKINHLINYFILEYFQRITLLKYECKINYQMLEIYFIFIKFKKALFLVVLLFFSLLKLNNKK